MAQQNRKAFTLLELIAVIGIVLILSSVVFAVVGSAKESGKSTVCLSNERQISAALLMYWDTYSAMPEVTDPGHPWEEAVSLPGKVHDWFEHEDLHCPDRQTPGNYRSPTGYLTTDSGYALNDCTSSVTSVSDLSDTILLTEIACINANRPDGSQNLFCRDIAEFPDWFYSKPGFDMQLGSLSNEPVGEWGSTRHRGRSHYAMMDGHVTVLSPEQIAVPKHDSPCKLNAAEWYGPPSNPRFATMQLSSSARPVGQL
jgi:prepilin-type N-terminal cleavage/methylation domain-containing protein/prepilin-type processing-associated H-X9-DG protein